ncbi:MAG: hypothetical protein JXM71_00110, partial [Spirochaetales bacterium]|nr:hypothetical protein [Spirochaetales bacterium]
MPATFAHVWLSRGALVAAGVFAYCAWLVFSMDRASKTNHVAVAFNLVFMIWAVGASFWYAAQDASSALALYKAFAWTWCVFPPLILHFTLRVARFRVFEGAGRLPFLAVLYTPALILSFVVPARVLADPVYRSGYWMLAIHAVPSYFIFVAHYLVMIALSVLIAFVQRARADDFRTRRRFTL